MHPAMLAVVLAGLLLRAWDIVATVTPTQWTIWATSGALVLVLVLLRRPR